MIFEKSDRPFLKSKNTTKKMMNYFLLSLIPLILFSLLKNGIIPYLKGYGNIFDLFYPLLLIFIGVFTTTLTEYLYYRFIKKEKNSINKVLNSYPYITGILLVLILPINTPISVLIIGCVIAILVGKLIYGGFGNNIFNPALIGGLFVITLYSTIISTSGGYLNKYEIDAISSATPLSYSKMVSAINYDSLVKPYGSLLDFFIGNIPGSIGETSSILCIIVFLFLSIKKVIKWKIPVFYVGTVFIMTSIIGFINGAGIWYPLFQILSGGLLFGAVFMATDPVTSPVTTIGQIMYGILLGILTTTFRFLTTYPEGVMTSILTLNMFVIILDRIGVAKEGSFKKSILPILILIVISLSITYKISYNIKYPDKGNNDFNIVNKEYNGEKTIYTVTQKGHGGLIKARITFLYDKVINIEILENNETKTYFKKIEDANYINKLIEHEDSLDDVDTISTATVSSSALKNMVINTKEDYRRN